MQNIHGFIDYFEEVNVFYIIVVFLSIMIILYALAICVCNENQYRMSGEPTLRHIKTSSEFSPPQNIGNESSYDVENNFIKNLNESALSSSEGHNDSGRVKSHDQRALPDIPAISQISVTQIEEEDEDSNLYDVISKSKNKNEDIEIQEVYDDTHVINHTSNFYELVTEKSDMMNGRILHPHPYAHVQIDRAHIDYVNINGSIDSLMDYKFSKGIGTAPQASIESLDDPESPSVSLSHLPPIPDKQFDQISEPSSGSLVLSTSSPCSPSKPISSSNSYSVFVANTHQRNASNTSIMNEIPFISSLSEEIVGHLNANESLNNQLIDEVLINHEPLRREPPYTSVTARESLANIRERQAQELLSNNALAAGASGPSMSAYDCMNYNLMRVGAEGPQTCQYEANDCYSAASDLYAEIGSDLGANSSRSSMYARVADMQFRSHIPTPPPVDALKRISTFGDEASEASYASVCHSKSQFEFYDDSSTGASGYDSQDGITPVYAAINKVKKNLPITQMIDSNEFPEYPSNSNQIYAQVYKPSSSEISSGQVMNQRPCFESGISSLNNNSIRSTCLVGAPGVSDPGYQTIECSYKNEPTYDIIKTSDSKISDLGSEYDPNYEHMPKNTHKSSAPLFDTFHIQSTISPGTWVRREHVYQEINEAQITADGENETVDFDESISTAL